MFVCVTVYLLLTYVLFLLRFYVTVHTPASKCLRDFTLGRYFRLLMKIFFIGLKSHKTQLLLITPGVLGR
jgi:hypothetical protein